MALTRLKNVFTSKTGRCLYVNSDDFDASDSFNNRGNSPNRPFKSIQRALLEAARFSYKSGQYNDSFEAFSIVLYPGDYVIDNRPGLNTAGKAFVAANIAELSESSDMELLDAAGGVNPNNILYQFNSIQGGVIVPRGTSIVGMDLRKTKIRPLYVPDPADTAVLPSAIFRVTGGCYFWQFSFFDGITQGVYKNPLVPSTIAPPTYSHHKLTCFEYADGRNTQDSFLDAENSNALSTSDLGLYYQKVAKAWQDIPDSTSIFASDELQARVEENRIVGPNSSGPISYSRIETDFVSTNVFTTTAEVETVGDHGFSVGTPVLLEGITGTDASRFNGSFFITAIPTPNTFRYTIKNPNIGAPSGNPTPTGTVKVEIDNVDSASPYIFNCSLRSTWGMQGMHADGSKATGFKSMVVAQFTGVSLQKDDNAFIKWDGSAYIAGSHTDGDSIYKSDYRNFHVKCSNDSVIQAVSVFAVGFADHFVAESGGDQSITNSNSNFGSCALRAKGFKTGAFTQDEAGSITHIIPPQKLARTYAQVSGTFTTSFGSINVTATSSTHGIVAGDYVRFENKDAIESYKVTAVAGNGNLTLNRGYRNLQGATEGAGIICFKGTVTEIPVGYVALDVQKIQKNCGTNFSRNTAWNNSLSGVQLGDSVVNNGNAYIAHAVANTGTVNNSAPTHTSGTAVNGDVTWAYIGAVDTRLYLYGYTSIATKPPYRLQGYSIGARKQDKVYVSLIDGSESATFAAAITPDNSTTPADNLFTNVTENSLTPGDANHPLQYDSYQQNWYLRVTAATSGDSTTSGAGNTTGYVGIHHHLGSDLFYANSLFTGSSYTQRIADNRSSRDRTYRVRYIVDNSILTSREPINGYVIQPRNVSAGNLYSQVYYIYDIQVEQELKRSVQDGIYYMTVLKGSITPTNGNLSGFSFGQNINNLYPTLDKDNPKEDPDAATSIASNTVVGLVQTTDGSTEDLSLSITKESVKNYIEEDQNNYVNEGGTGNPASEGYITLEARDGNAAEIDRDLRMVPVIYSGGSAGITATELRRPSILRSGNHTFEYVGFGPGNYSTGLPQVQNRVLTEAETLLAQSQKEDGGIAFYSGLNSNGDLFIGNTRISTVTGEEASLDTPTLSIVGETANLRPVFDEIIIRDKITVENTTLNSVFKGGIEINEDLIVSKSAEVADLTIKGEAVNNEASKKINVITGGSTSSPTPPSAVDYGNTGDFALKGIIPTATGSGNQQQSSSIGWFYTGAAWAPFGLTDTGNLNITGGSVSGSGATASWVNGAGDLQLLNGLGLDIKSTGTLNVNSGASTLGGNLTVSGNSEFNGTVDVDADFAVRNNTTDKFFVDNVTGNTTISGDLSVNGTASATTFSGSFSGNASSATKLQTARNIGGVSFDGTASINLPGVNTGGNQDTSGTATQADNINIDEKNDNVSYQLTFSAQNSAGYQRQYIDTNNAHLEYNPSTNNLSGIASLTATTFVGNGDFVDIDVDGTADIDDLNVTGSLDITQSLRRIGQTNTRIDLVNGGIQLKTGGTAKLSLSGDDVDVVGTVTAAQFGTSSQNAYGARTVGTGTPTGGSNGDIYYKY